MLSRVPVCTVCLVVVFCFVAAAQAFEGQVVAVADGDTITVVHTGQDERIRLYGIDCPEKRQDFGLRAKRFTHDMVYGRVVDVETVARDRYGRTVGIVMLDGRCLNAALVQSGYAWLYTRYCDLPLCQQWQDLEVSARLTNTGLWAVANPVPPWEYRR